MEKSLIMKDFNSQVCTSVEQSKRLLAIGLKPETADMYITNMSTKGFQYTDPWQIGSISYKDVMSFWTEKGLKLENTYWEIIPAWSLHRLMIIGNIGKSGFTNVNEAYNTCISLIASHIRFGLLNKEYFKQ